MSSEAASKMKPPARRFELPPLHEYRFELEGDEKVGIRLAEGMAEINGMEMSSTIEWPMGDEVKGAVWTWEGCTIEVTGRPSTEYVASESPIPVYFSLSLALDKLRLASLPPADFTPPVLPPALLQPPTEDAWEPTPGPRVLVIGGPSSGKSTLVKALVNWSIRTGRTRKEGPGLLAVSLDPGEGGWTMPGTFSVAPVGTTLPTTTPVLPTGTTSTSGPPSLPTPGSGRATTSSGYTPEAQPALLAPPLNALTYFYGHLDPSRNEPLAIALLKALGDATRKRLEDSGESSLWRSGCIVDTPASWAEKSKGGMVKETVRAFGITVLVVIGGEKLHLEMSKLMSTNKTVTVLRVPKSGGASDVELSARRRIQASQIRSYFYGGPSLSAGSLSPFNLIVKFSDLTLYRVGAEAAVPDSALPLGAQKIMGDRTLVRVDPEEEGSGVVGRVGALLGAEWEGEGRELEEGEEPALSSVMGFIHIAGADVKTKKWTVLSPLPGKLPKKWAIVGSVEWLDA